VSGEHVNARAAATPATTLRRTLGAGPVLRRGTLGRYRALMPAAGEPHLLRADLAPTGAASGPGLPLACLVHVTDLQVADIQSPARFEFFNRELGDPRFAALVPTQRPQEALTVHAVDAMVRTLNALPGGPVTRAPVAAVVTTGDAIDNAQWNELEMFLALLDGGRVCPGSGGRVYEGVQSPDWPDDVFWKPDGGRDVFRERYGFPDHPGLLQRALADFQAAGLRLPWLACFGNHEALTQGVGALTDALRAYLVGGTKAVGPPETMDRDKALEVFMTTPEVFLTGAQRAVTPDPGRRAISRPEFVAAHFRSAGRPRGHGFTRQNARDGTAYYAYDLPGLRLLTLDTNCVAGAADGGLDADQARWLEQRLVEVHSRYRAADGTDVHGRGEDRLVVVVSHHGIDTLTDSRRLAREGLHGGRELTTLLHRFDNVVLWLNGHTHVNAVRPRPNPRSPGRGFWEVTTCAIVDWPCQARVVELLARGEDTLSIVCTMLDHGAPVRHEGAEGRQALASLHRELAGNVPSAGLDSAMAGTLLDRNVELLVRAPFPLRRLPASPRF
jgi:metallophosphoesterase (TIGR03767 family)